MQDKITANYPIDEAAIRDLLRRKLLEDRGGGDGEPRGSRFTEDGDYRGRAPDKRARFSVLHDQAVNRNTHPI